MKPGTPHIKDKAGQGTQDQSGFRGPFRSQGQGLLEKHILAMLFHEWDQAVRNLGLARPDLVSGMQRPGIFITDLGKTLGQWHHQCHEIRMSRALVTGARWDSICEVFRHEMAHQLASTFPESHGQPSHGPLFRECCEWLGANPRASGSYQTLEERIWGRGGDGPEDENDRILLKVKKLMGLAGSGNRHEAELAAAKAAELIARYNIDIIDRDRDRTFESIVITKPALKRSQAEILMVGVLNSYYFVRCVWIPVFVPDRERMGTALEISGTSTNIRLADYAFHYVMSCADRYWDLYRGEHPGCRSGSGFRTGVVYGFRKRLDQSLAPGVEKCAAASPAVRTSPVASSLELAGVLVIPEDRRLSSYVKGRYPGLRTSRVRQTTTSLSAFESGLARGRALVVSKGITVRGPGTGMLTGPRTDQDD
ncbi:MAG: SprT-like domain-containing protein [Pseudomonadota bacterium]